MTATRPASSLRETCSSHARWLVHASYTGQRVSLKPLPESRDTTNARAEADDPAHMFSMRSYLNLPGRSRA